MANALGSGRSRFRFPRLGFRGNLRIARVARKLSESGDPFAQLRMACELERTPLEIPESGCARFGDLSPAAVASVRQRLVAFLVYRMVLPAFMRHIVAPGERVVLPLPAAWRRRTRELGVRLQPLRSWALWVLVLLGLYARGLSSGARLLRLSLGRRMPPVPSEPYSVLLNLTRSNLPPADVTPAYDLVSWYRSSSLKPADVRTVWAHVPGEKASTAGPSLVLTPHYFPALEGRFRNLLFAGRLILASGRALAGMVRGHWWEAVLHEQAVDLIYARMLQPGALARAYLFNNASFVLRPLWTYWAETQGAHVYLVFYATNIETFPSEKMTRAEWPGYRGMTWPRYVAWDDFQADFLGELGHGDRDITIVGEVGFTDKLTSPAELPPPPFVAVFDVTPQHSVSLARRGMPQVYYTADVAARFMGDLADLLAQRGLSMVQKRKRDIGRMAAPQYRWLIRRVERQSQVFSVDSQVAPQRLVAGATAVVSMPFTSTALIARNMGVPSVYYDPLGILAGERRLAHGIPILGGRDALASWLDSLPQSCFNRDTRSGSVDKLD